MFHTFDFAVVCWSIWKTRNSACIENKRINYSVEILCRACAYMKFFTCLHKTSF
jgi:hypothetical protein